MTPFINFGFWILDFRLPVRNNPEQSKIQNRKSNIRVAERQRVVE